MDWHEGFQIYGEHGSVVAKSFLPWYHRSSEVECFSARDGQYHRPLGEDAHFWRRQVEGFADSDPHRSAAARRRRRRRARRDAGDGRDRALGRDRRDASTVDTAVRGGVMRRRDLRQDVQPRLARRDARRRRRTRDRGDPVQHGARRRPVPAARDHSRRRPTRSGRGRRSRPHHGRRVGDVQHGPPRSPGPGRPEPIGSRRSSPPRRFSAPAWSRSAPAHATPRTCGARIPTTPARRPGETASSRSPPRSRWPSATTSSSPSSPSTTTSSATRAAGRRLLDELRSEHLKVVLDAANLIRPGELARQHETLREAFALLGDDARPRARQGRPRRRHDRRRGPRRPRLRALRGVAARRRLHGPLVLHGLSEDEVPSLRGSSAGTSAWRARVSPTHSGPDGLAFSYLDEGSGNPFVFQHGLGGGSSLWSGGGRSGGGWGGLVGGVG